MREEIRVGPWRKGVTNNCTHVGCYILAVTLSLYFLDKAKTQFNDMHIGISLSGFIFIKFIALVYVAILNAILVS